MNRITLISLILISIINLSCSSPKDKTDDDLMKKAVGICNSYLLLDAHIDWPERQAWFPMDIAVLNDHGNFDYERGKKGGLNAVLSVSYISPKLSAAEGRLLHDSIVQMIEGFASDNPDKFALAKNPSELRQNFEEGLMSLPICLENGSPLGDSLTYLSYLKEQGIAYITLCHTKSNQLCDANYDSERPWQGLSPMGEEVVKEMNRLGIIIDISHSTDRTVFDVLEISEAPIVASHSSCRYFTPGLERNLPDTLITGIAAGGGVVMLNYASFQLDEKCSKTWTYLWREWQDSTGISLYSKEGTDFLTEYGKTHHIQVGVKKLVDHIDHIVKLAGIDYVGIGSDYDGLPVKSLPFDLPDVSTYPLIVKELLTRDYSEEDIRKILSGNFLRVWEEVLSFGE